MVAEVLAPIDSITLMFQMETITPLPASKILEDLEY